MNKENFTWYESGAKKASHKCSYISNGTYTTWYEDGQKESERSFKNGNLYGLYTTWYEDGQKESEMKFITDNRIFSMDGEMKLYEIHWSKDGKEISKEIFFNENNLPKFRNPLSPQSVNTSLTGVCVDPQVKLIDKIKSWFD
jgi:antitoxin component YwqK of YwqJK toxin-antitoxin module